MISITISSLNNIFNPLNLNITVSCSIAKIDISDKAVKISEISILDLSPLVKEISSEQKLKIKYSIVSNTEEKEEEKKLSELFENPKNCLQTKGNKESVTKITSISITCESKDKAEELKAKLEKVNKSPKYSAFSIDNEGKVVVDSAKAKDISQKVLTSITTDGVVTFEKGSKPITAKKDIFTDEGKLAEGVTIKLDPVKDTYTPLPESEPAPDANTTKITPGVIFSLDKKPADDIKGKKINIIYPVITDGKITSVIKSTDSATLEDIFKKKVTVEKETPSTIKVEDKAGDGRKAISTSKLLFTPAEGEEITKSDATKIKGFVTSKGEKFTITVESFRKGPVTPGIKAFDEGKEIPATVIENLKDPKKKEEKLYKKGDGTYEVAKAASSGATEVTSITVSSDSSESIVLIDSGCSKGTFMDHIKENKLAYGIGTVVLVGAIAAIVLTTKSSSSESTKDSE